MLASNLRCASTTWLVQAVLTLRCAVTHARRNGACEPESADGCSLIWRAAADRRRLPRLCTTVHVGFTYQNFVFLPFLARFLRDPGTDPPSTESLAQSPDITASAVGFDPHDRNAPTRQFRTLVSPAPAHPLSKTKWRRFWKMQIPHCSRTVWFRALHHRLPNRLILSRILPNIFTDPSCPLCHAALEDSVHFLVLCPAKLMVWQAIWPVYFTSPFQASLVLAALRQMRIPVSVSLKGEQIIGCVLQGIWNSHWQYIFSSVPFVSSAVVASIQKQITTFKAESRL